MEGHQGLEGRKEGALEQHWGGTVRDEGRGPLDVRGGRVSLYQLDPDAGRGVAGTAPCELLPCQDP